MALLRESLSEGRVGRGSVLVGLDPDVRKRVHTLVSIVSPLPAIASAMVRGHVGAKLRYILEALLGHASSFQTSAGRAFPAGAQEGLLE